MDIGLGAGTVTIFSSNLGDGSMYTSTCGEILGGGKHENVRKASTNFVMIAGGFIDKMTLTTKFPLSLKKQCQIYLLTPTGVYTIKEINASLLAAGNNEKAPLILANNDAITTLGIVSPQKHLHLKMNGLGNLKQTAQTLFQEGNGILKNLKLHSSNSSYSSRR